MDTCRHEEERADYFPCYQPQSGCDSTLLNALIKLYSLYLLYNSHLQCLPQDLSGLATLNLLKLEYCDFVEFPILYDIADTLERLFLGHNQRLSILPPERLIYLSKLKTLHLR